MSDPETRAARRVGMAELDLDLSGRSAPQLDEDGRPKTREDEMVEPADQEDPKYRETAGSVGPETADVDGEPTPLVAPEERSARPNQVRTGGGGQATPDDVPDAPVPWERSDARPMTPAEHGDHATQGDQRGTLPKASPERSMTDPDKGTGPD